MDANLNSLILRVRAEHDCRPGASAGEIDAAEARVGFRFTEDLRALLLVCNGIQFWKDGNFPCRLLSANEINSVHQFLGGEEGPKGLVAIIEFEADIVGLGLDPESRCYSRVIDCCHETFPYELPGICNSVSELLAIILDSNDDEWPWPAARDFDVDFAE